MRLQSAWTVLLLGATACAADRQVAPPPPPPPQTFRLEISPSAGGQHYVGMGLGATWQLTPRLIGSFGDTLAVSGSVSYTSQLPARVSVSASGLLTALALGPTTVMASTIHVGQTLTDILAVTVTCTAELRATVTPVEPVIIVVGQGFTPTILLTTCGGLITLTRTITWSAADPTVVSVNPTTGQTTGLRTGATIVYANVEGYGILVGIQVTVQ